MFFSASVPEATDYEDFFLLHNFIFSPSLPRYTNYPLQSTSKMKTFVSASSAAAANTGIISSFFMVGAAITVMALFSVPLAIGEPIEGVEGIDFCTGFLPGFTCPPTISGPFTPDAEVPSGGNTYGECRIPPPLPTISASEAFDAYQEQSITSTFNYMTGTYDGPETTYNGVVVIDVRNPEEIYWVGQPAQVNEIILKNNEIIVPYNYKATVVDGGQAIEYQEGTNGNLETKTLRMTDIERMDLKPFAISSAVENKNSTNDFQTFLNPELGNFLDEILLPLVEEQKISAIAWYCRSGKRSSRGCYCHYCPKLLAVPGLANFEIDLDTDNGFGGFEGTSYSNRYLGHRGFPSRVEGSASDESVSFKDMGLPISIGQTPITSLDALPDPYSGRPEWHPKYTEGCPDEWTGAFEDIPPECNISPPLISIEATEAFDMYQELKAKEKKRRPTVLMLDVRTADEAYWTGQAAQVDEITLKNGASIIPYRYKAVLEDTNKIVYYEDDEDDQNSRRLGKQEAKRTKKVIDTDDVSKITLSPIALNIPVQFVDPLTGTKSLNQGFGKAVDEIITEFPTITTIIWYCRSGLRSSIGCYAPYCPRALASPNIVNYEVEGTSNGNGGFEGSSYSNSRLGYRGFPNRDTEGQSVSFKDQGLPIVIGMKPVSTLVVD